MFVLIFVVLAVYGIIMTILVFRGRKTAAEDIEKSEAYISLKKENADLRKTIANIQTREETDASVKKTVQGFTEAWFADAWYTDRRAEDCLEYLTDPDVMTPYLPYTSGDPGVASNPTVKLSDFSYTYRMIGDNAEAVATIGYDVTVAEDNYEVFRFGYVCLFLEKQPDGSFLISEIRKISDLVQ